MMTTTAMVRTASAHFKHRVSSPAVSFLAWATLILASSCSIWLDDEARQCDSDLECNARGFAASRCDLDTRVCVASEVSEPENGTGSITGDGPSLPPVPPDAMSGGTRGNDGSAPTEQPQPEPEVDGGAGPAPCAEPESCPAVGVCPEDPSACEGVIWTLSAMRPAIGDSTGGSAFAEVCPEDELLIGMRLGFGLWLDRVQGLCGKPALDLDGAAPEIHVTRGTELPAHPVSDIPISTTALVCPSPAVLTGVHLAQQYYDAAEDLRHVVLTRVWLTCSDLTVSSLPEGGHVLDWTASFEIGPLEGSYADGTAFILMDQLPVGQVAVGLHGMSGAWMDKLGFSSGVAASQAASSDGPSTSP